MQPGHQREGVGEVRNLSSGIFYSYTQPHATGTSGNEAFHFRDSSVTKPPPRAF